MKEDLNKKVILKISLMSSMLVIQNKKKNLDKFVWFNQVVLFLQSFCFTIELLVFLVNNIKLCRSCQYYCCLNHFGLIFPFVSPENIKNLWIFYVSKKINFDFNWFHFSRTEKLQRFTIILFWKLLTGKINLYNIFGSKLIFCIL